MTREGSGPDLEALLEDALTAPSCDPELVVRYAQEPGALSATERAEVEAWLGEAPHRDAVSAMHGVRAALQSEAAPRRARGAAPRSDRQRGWRALRALGGLAAAAAAALALMLLLEGDAPDPGERIARAPAGPPQPAPPSPESVPAPTPPGATPGPAPETREAEPAPAPDPLAAPAPPSRPDPAPAPPESPAPAAPAPILVAMVMPGYSAPPGGARTRIDSALRSAPDAPAPFAISPEHVARASHDRPELYWYLPTLPGPGAEIWLTVVQGEQADPLADTRIDVPARPGLQRTTLPGELRLQPGVEYVWTVSVRPDLERPSRDLLSQGWIRHVPLDPAARARARDAAPGARPAIWAELGYFYDAFAGLAELAAMLADDDRPRAAMRALLEQAGIDPARAGLQAPRVDGRVPG